ncbi:hypothetical protein ABK040_015854 [Willaertia magna]
MLGNTCRKKSEEEDIDDVVEFLESTFKTIEKPESIPKAITQETIIKSLLRVFKEWNESQYPPKVVYLLQHKYSKYGLNFTGLKGRDSNVVTLLQQAKAIEDSFEMYLTLFTKHESGGASGGYNDYYDSYSKFEMDGVEETDYTVSNWIDCNNTVVNFPEVAVDEEDVFPNADIDNIDLVKEDVSEHSGNEGATMDRWYTTAALVIWPKSNGNNIYLSLGTNASMQRLQEMMKNITFPLSDTDKNSPLVLHCIKFAIELISRWDTNGEMSLMVDILIKLDHFNLVELFCKQAKPKKIKVMMKLCNCFGWDRLSSFFTPVLEQMVKENISECINIAERLLIDKSNIFNPLIDIITINMLQKQLGETQTTQAPLFNIIFRQNVLSIDDICDF